MKPRGGDPTFNSRGVFIGAAGLLILVLTLQLALARLFRAYRSGRAGASTLVMTLPPTPVEIESGEQAADLRRAQDELLGRFEWLDRKAGVARIPIARAMELEVRRYEH